MQKLHSVYSREGDDMARLTDAEIRAAIEQWEVLNAARRVVIESTEADIRRYRAELERREQAAQQQAEAGQS